MKNMQKWMLGAVVAAGVLGLGTTAAQAAEFGVYVNRPPAYAPPAPGPGFELVAGYPNHGYRGPDRWNHVGIIRNYPVARFEDRRFDRGRVFRSEPIRARGWDRGRGYRR
jgi:hypothetical protein